MSKTTAAAANPHSLLPIIICNVAGAIIGPKCDDKKKPAYPSGWPVAVLTQWEQARITRRLAGNLFLAPLILGGQTNTGAGLCRDHKFFRKKINNNYHIKRAQGCQIAKQYNTVCLGQGRPVMQLGAALSGIVAEQVASYLFSPDCPLKASISSVSSSAEVACVVEEGAKRVELSPTPAGVAGGCSGSCVGSSSSAGSV